MSLRELGITLADKTMRQSAVIVTAPREANKPVFTPFFHGIDFCLFGWSVLRQIVSRSQKIDHSVPETDVLGSPNV